MRSVNGIKPSWGITGVLAETVYFAVNRAILNAHKDCGLNHGFLLKFPVTIERVQEAYLRFEDIQFSRSVFRKIDARHLFLRRQRMPEQNLASTD